MVVWRIVWWFGGWYVGLEGGMMVWRVMWWFGESVVV